MDETVISVTLVYLSAQPSFCFVPSNRGRISIKFDGVLSVLHVRSGAVRSKMVEQTCMVVVVVVAAASAAVLVRPSLEGRM